MRTSLGVLQLHDLVGEALSKEAWNFETTDRPAATSQQFADRKLTTKLTSEKWTRPDEPQSLQP